MQNRNAIRGALRDIAQAFGRPHLWRDLAWFDVLQRFRRSVLGPLWITLSMAALVAGMGPLYAAIFGADVRSYLPYLAVGVIVWSFMSSTVNDACNAFISCAGVIKQVKLPLASYVLRAVARNLFVFSFNWIIIACVMFYAGFPGLWNIVVAGAGLLLLIVALIGVSFVVAVFCTRYRDLHQVVASVMQLMMFLTPVFWRADQVQQRSVFVEWNPAYYFMEVVRAPLLGIAVGSHVYEVAAIVALATLIIGFSIFAKCKDRIVYWL